MMDDEPQQFYIVSLRTVQHRDAAYIGCAPGKDARVSTGSAWFITAEFADAYDFGSLGRAQDFIDQLRAGEAYGLKNDGRLWHMASRI